MIRGFSGKNLASGCHFNCRYFSRASTCRTVFRNQDMVGLIPTALEDTFAGVEGLYDKIKYTCPLLPHIAWFLKMFTGACKKKWEMD